MGSCAWTSVLVSLLLWSSGLVTPHITSLPSYGPSGPAPVPQAHTLCVGAPKPMAKYLCLFVLVPCLAQHVQFPFQRDVEEPYGKA